MSIFKTPNETCVRCQYRHPPVMSCEAAAALAKREREQSAAPMGGITKRELFAAMAMQGILATNQGQQAKTERVAHAACAAADDLIKELEK